MKNYCETIYYCATLKAEIVAGRKSCAKKILRRKSPNFRNFFFRNNVIFHNSQLFLPQQYNLSQFASFFPAIYTLRILTDVPQLTNFFTSFALPSPAPYSNPPPPAAPPPKVYYFYIDWYTCKILSNLVNFPYFNSCLGYFFTNFSYVAQTPPSPFFLPVYQIFGKSDDSEEENDEEIENN